MLKIWPKDRDARGEAKKGRGDRRDGVGGGCRADQAVISVLGRGLQRTKAQKESARLE